jgi:hypothetical protein
MCIRLLLLLDLRRDGEVGGGDDEDVDGDGDE